MSISSTSGDPRTLRIDIVSDVVCPWCAVGLASLQRALDELGGELRAELHFHPFELNPQLGPGGVDLVEYLSAKYGSSPAQIEQMHAQIAARGAAVGFRFDFGKRSRSYNTRSAHRLLHWAGEVDAADGGARQLALKQALLQAHFGEGQDPGDPQLLRRLAESAGLDGAQAAAILASERYDAEVEAAEAQWQALGIRSVPAFVVEERHLISGGQPPEVFVQALRQIASAAAEA